MREILFRGKQADNEKWVIGYLSSKHTITIQTPCGHMDEIVICADTVGQFTGLTDKNGKRIFENGYMIIDKQTYKVLFDNGEYILKNIFNCDIIQLKNNSNIGVFVDEI